LLSPEALFLAQNAPQVVWWPGSVWTRWGSLQRSPDPWLDLGVGPRKGEREGEEGEGWCRGGMGEGKKEKGWGGKRWGSEMVWEW